MPVLLNTKDGLQRSEKLKNNNTHADLSIESYGNIKGKPFSFAVLPWGSTEPHNYHLPYLTDCWLAQDIAVDAAEKALNKYKLHGTILPVIPLGSQNHTLLHFLTRASG